MNLLNLIMVSLDPINLQFSFDYKKYVLVFTLGLVVALVISWLQFLFQCIVQ